MCKLPRSIQWAAAADKGGDRDLLGRHRPVNTYGSFAGHVSEPVVTKAPIARLDPIDALELSHRRDDPRFAWVIHRFIDEHLGEAC